MVVKMALFNVIIVTCLSMTMDFVSASTTSNPSSTPHTASFFTSPPSAPVSTAQRNPIVAQDGKSPLKLHTQITPLNSSESTCPHGFRQIRTPCFSTDSEPKWPLCRNGSLQTTHGINTDEGDSCFYYERTNKLSIRDFMIVWDDPPVREDEGDGNTTSVRKALQRESDYRSQISRCSGFLESEITCWRTELLGSNSSSSLSSEDCYEDWFSGSLDAFTPVSTNNESVNLFHNGTYISPIWWNVITKNNIPKGHDQPIHQNKTGHIGVCGKNIVMINCDIFLTEQEYSFVDGFAIFNGSYYFSEEYEYLSNDSIRICIDKFTKTESRRYRLWQKSLHRLYIFAEIMYGISPVCLFLLLITYCLFPPLRNFQGWAIISFVLSLLITKLYRYTQFTFIKSPALCQSMGVFRHFAYLSVFTWMNVLDFSLCLSFRGTLTRPRHKSTNNLKRYARYSLFGWGVPFIFIVIGLGLNFTDNKVIPLKYGSLKGRMCWITPKLALQVFFVGPVFISVVANILFFIVTVVNIWRTTKMTQSALGHDRDMERKRKIAELLVYFKISCLVGFCWILGPILSWIPSPTRTMEYLFNIANSFQDIIIFFSFGLNARVRNMWREKLRSVSCRCRSLVNSKTSRSTCVMAPTQSSSF